MIIYFSSASAEAKYPLTSFDKALYKLGLENVNLIKLSSVLPENASIVRTLPRPIKIGEIVKAVYTHITTNKGIASCGLAVGMKKGGGGLFYEYAQHNASQKEVKQVLQEMIKEAFEIREWELDSIEYALTEAKPSHHYATALAVAAFFDK
ncbi:MAG: pyruvoyl-dependent arginine decarboxylase [Candidatus Nanohaloarchaeota archaeon]|nr:pyruvoyl-dependent arginine decarboxylase [Candidatus Nanohaloarchaeota archaeon]